VDENAVAAALARAVRRAIERHRRLGEAIAFVRDGRVVVEVPGSSPKPPRTRRAARGRRASRRT